MVVFLYTSPFVVALGMPLISRAERLSVAQVIGLVIAFAGAASAFAEGFTTPAAGDRQWIGDTLGVAAAVLWGATTLAIRATKLSSASAEKTLLYQLGISGVMLAIGALAVGTPLPKSIAGLSALTLASLAFQTVVVAFASFLLWFWLMRRYPATRMASFTLLTPVFGLLLGALLLSEPITGRLVLALAAVSAGIVMVNRAKPAAR
jgi:drug/metabolite transporter (DMT)-like permease